MNDGGDGGKQDVAPSTTIGRVDMDAGVPPDTGRTAWSPLNLVVTLLVVLLMVGALTLILSAVFHAL